jgi:hypothetical protein
MVDTRRLRPGAPHLLLGHLAVLVGVGVGEPRPEPRTGLALGDGAGKGCVRTASGSRRAPGNPTHAHPDANIPRNPQMSAGPKTYEPVPEAEGRGKARVVVKNPLPVATKGEQTVKTMDPTPPGRPQARRVPPGPRLSGRIEAGSMGGGRTATFLWCDPDSGACVRVEVAGDREFLTALEACGLERCVGEPTPACDGAQSGRVRGRSDASNAPSVPSDSRGMEGPGSEAGDAVRSLGADERTSPWGAGAPEGEGWISPRRGQSEGRGRGRRRGA